jgi:hypothetical protein
MTINDELISLYSDVAEQHDRCESGSKEREYWQGKKDGLRTALALLQPERNWTALNDSSWDKRSTDLELLKSLVQDATFYIGEILWSHKPGNGKVHPLSWTNMRNWFRQVKMNADRLKIDIDGVIEENDSP